MTHLSTAMVLASLMAGCGESAPPAPPQSVPVAQAASATPQAEPMRVVVPKTPGTVEDVAPISELEAHFPALAGLSRAQKEVAVGAMHLVPGPCPPCTDAKEHLARCALRAASAACANVPGLVNRAITAAKANKTYKSVMEQIHYPDVWRPVPGAEAGRVAVDLILAAEDPWAPDALAAKAALESRYGARIQVRVSAPESSTAKAIGVRATPTWAVAGYRMRGAQSAPALGRLIDRELGGQP